MRREVWLLTLFTAIEFASFLSSKPLINNPNPSQLNHRTSKAPLAPVTKQVTNVKAFGCTGYGRDVMRSVIQRHPFTTAPQWKVQFENIQVLWDVTPCRWVNNYRRFEGS